MKSSSVPLLVETSPLPVHFAVQVQALMSPPGVMLGVVATISRSVAPVAGVSQDSAVAAEARHLPEDLRRILAMALTLRHPRLLRLRELVSTEDGACCERSCM